MDAPAEKLAGSNLTPIAGTNFNVMKAARGRSVRERFEEKVHKGQGCWLWIGSRVNGYGQLMINRRPARAHRVSYELNFGPIPAGMFVCHRCDNPSCVRPSHLFLGTPADNLGDCKRKGRLNNPAKGAPGESNSQAKLTSEQVRQIRALGKQMGSRARVARRFGLSPSTVQRICNGSSWRNA